MSQTRKKAHLCLVSHQVTPNITPVLDPKTRPDVCILLVSHNMQAHAQHLAKVLQEAAGVEVKLHHLNDPWDIHSCQDAVMECLAENELLDIELNVTGGTKPLSIAAYEVCRAEGKPIFYVHPNSDQLIWMYPKERGHFSLDNRIRLNHFLNAHGVQIASKGAVMMPPGQQYLTEELICNIDHYSKLLVVLNWYAAKAKNSLRFKLEPEHLQDSGFNQLLKDFSAENVLSILHGEVAFKDESARFFANGGWLENHVFRIVNQLKTRHSQLIQDAAQSVETLRDDGVKNESDVMLLAENRLYLIECKTKKFATAKSKNQRTAAAAESLYKLDSLAENLGGLKASGMLISYLPVSKADLKRAESLKITVVQHHQLQRLGHYVLDWIQG